MIARVYPELVIRKLVLFSAYCLKDVILLVILTPTIDSFLLWSCSSEMSRFLRFVDIRHGWFWYISAFVAKITLSAYFRTAESSIYVSLTVICVVRKVVRLTALRQ